MQQNTIFTLNFDEFLHTMYKYVPNSVVQISKMFAKYFKYYTIILGVGIFVDILNMYCIGTKNYSIRS